MAAFIPWITFFIGLFVGVLLTWLITIGNKRDLEASVDRLQQDLRGRDADLAACREESQNKIAEFKTQVRGLKSDLKAQAEELEFAVAGLEVRKSELAACQLELEAKQVQVDELREQMQARAVAAVQVPDRSGAAEVELETPEVDDFTQIDGIGPVLAARLSAAGIYRFADLAEANPQELPNALGIQPWQKVQPEAWISEAAVLAKRPERVQIGDDLTLLEGIGPTYATRLRAAGITTYEQLAASEAAVLASIIGAPGWRRVNYGDWIEQARLAAAGDERGLKELQEKLFRHQGDNLALIAGIGPRSLAVLQEGGIDNYAALAAADPDDLAALFKEADVRGGDFEAWITEAKLRAAGKRVKRSRSRLPQRDAAEIRSCPQDLELIEGIGTIYEQRLYEVGAGTFWEVGMLPEALLAEILQVEDFQDVDLAVIKADAKRLAEETDSMGYVWDGTIPDNFEPLTGIGPVLERRLYAAGICTYEALAAATVELLEKACQAPAFQKVDYALWIRQAKELMS